MTLRHAVLVRTVVAAAGCAMSWGGGPAAAEAPTTQPEATPAAADTESAEKQPGFFDDFWTRPRMTGDWGGKRSELEAKGFKFNLYYNHFYGINLQGGQDVNNAQRNSGTWDLHIFLDFEKMGLIPGGELFIWPKGHFSHNINPKVGALGEPFDDADGDKVVYIDVLQYQQKLAGDKLRLRAGYLDLQTIFDRNQYANTEDRQFFNTFLDNNSPIVPLKIGLGAVMFVDPVEWFGVAIGAADGDARLYRTGLDTAFHDGADFFGFVETEFRVKVPSPKGVLPGNYRFGAVYDPGTKVVFRDTLGGLRSTWSETGDVGYWTSFDQLLWRENSDGLQGLGWFFRWGTREGDVNRISYTWSTGAQYQGLVPERNADVLGFGMYQVNSSHLYRREVNEDFVRETGYELYYQVEIAPWLTFTPDLQYIATPGGLTTTRDAVVMGFRVRVTF